MKMLPEPPMCKRPPCMYQSSLIIVSRSRGSGKWRTARGGGEAVLDVDQHREVIRADHEDEREKVGEEEERARRRHARRAPPRSVC